MLFCWFLSYFGYPKHILIVLLLITVDIYIYISIYLSGTFIDFFPTSLVMILNLAHFLLYANVTDGGESLRLILK